MPALEGLKRIGFTDNEAKVYLALLSHPGITGYEVSRISGVPRAKVYEVLEGLTDRGAVLVEPGEERSLYRALPYTALLGEYRRRSEALLSDLYRDLSKHVRPEVGPATAVLTGLPRSLARAAELAAGARHSLLAAGRPEELQSLGPALSEAERRGVTVAVLSRGPVRLNLMEVYIQSSRNPEMTLALVADHSRLLMVDLTAPEGGHAILSTAQGTAAMVASWLRKEIAFGEIERCVGDRIFEFLPAAAVAQMTRLWRA